ncbi:MAG: hypothetical protein P1U49_18585 [Minwuia sp.]|nr:hypothetical protein [Minwuia sp.]
MPLLLSLVTEDDILEKSNDENLGKSERTSKLSFEDPKARKSLQAAIQGKTLLQRITEEKKHD